MPRIPLLQTRPHDPGSIRTPEGKLFAQVLGGETDVALVLNCINAFKMMAAELDRTPGEVASHIVDTYLERRGPIKLVLNSDNNVSPHILDGHVEVRGPGE